MKNQEKLTRAQVSRIEEFYTNELASA